jgi:hypothetical protein
MSGLFVIAVRAIARLWVVQIVFSASNLNGRNMLPGSFQTRIFGTWN